MSVGKRLAGRSALITGAADGIGRGMALRFAQEGGSILVADFNADKGVEVVEELRGLGVDADFRKCDVTVRVDVVGAVQACVDRFGSIDVLVNNAFSGGGL